MQKEGERGPGKRSRGLKSEAAENGDQGGLSEGGSKGITVEAAASAGTEGSEVGDLVANANRWRRRPRSEAGGSIVANANRRRTGIY